MSSFGVDEMERLFERHATVAAAITDSLKAKNRLIRAHDVEDFALGNRLIEAACHSLAVVGAQALDAPIAMVTMLTEKPNVDYLAAAGAPKSDSDPCNESMCQYTVHFDSTLAVTDLADHPEWSKGAARYGLQSYIGSPWRRDGYPMGTYCLLDDERRDWTDEEIALVETLAQQVTDLIEIGGS